MQFQLKRILVFTADMPAMSAFYEFVLGLTAVNREPGWIEYDAGACAIALHAGNRGPGKRPPKLVFYARDVAAARALLTKRGAKMGPITSTGAFDMCDGKDPDGNPFQVSSR